MAPSLRLRMSWRALGVLWSRTGWRSAGVFWAVAWRGLGGAPWRQLPKPVDAREAACRDMVGPVMLLDDALAERMGADRGRAIVAEMVRESALVQLASLVPGAEVSELRERPADQRESRLQAIVQRFPNATVGPLESGPSSFAYPVTRCAFVALCQATGRADLARIFCAADALHFERNLEGVQFERPENLADGGERCDFRFRW